MIPIPRDCRRAGRAGRFFFATREAAERALERWERGHADRQAVLIGRLRRAMADAHPDHGGTAEQFMDARRRYRTALAACETQVS